MLFLRLWKLSAANTFTSHTIFNVISAQGAKQMGQKGGGAYYGNIMVTKSNKDG